MTARFAVFGHPVAHSLSPRIHAAFGSQLGIALQYGSVDCEPWQLSAALAEFAAAGGIGANLTLPHKQAGLTLCASVSARARQAGAVNTLRREGDGWFGDNTDGDGLVRDLTGRNALDLRGRRTLMLGAGGAAHGVAPALLDAGIGELFVVNRHAERADALVDALAQPGRVHSRYWDDLPDIGGFDLIINATSAGLGGAAIALPFSLAASRSAAVDLSYGEAAIGFLAWARAAGAHDVVDGLGMLVEQAALAFELWHGRRPQTDEVYATLRARDALLVTGD